MSEKTYNITVQGEYFANDGTGKGKLVKRYDVIVTLSQKYMDAAMSHIKNHLLTPALKAKYPDYARYRTHEITATVDCENPMDSISDPRHMSKAELLQHIKNYNLPVLPVLYPMVSELRAAVLKCTDNRLEFEEEQKNIRELRGDRVERDVELKDLNPELAGYY